MLENTPTRGTKEPAQASTKAAPNAAEKTAPAGGDGEAPASQVQKAATLLDSMPDLVRILAENIRHNTELLERIDKRRAEQTGDRAAGAEQLRTILDYKAIGQMVGRSGTAFQDNLIHADRQSDGGKDRLYLGGLPDGAATVSVQVDGVPNAEVFDDFGKITLKTARGRDIGRIEVLNRDDEPIGLGPRMVAVSLTNNPSPE
jgi:hypothetical protein